MSERPNTHNMHNKETNNKLKKKVAAGLLLAAGGATAFLGMGEKSTGHIPSHSIEWTVEDSIPEGGSVAETVYRLVDKTSLSESLSGSQQTELMDSAKDADREYRHTMQASPHEGTKVEILSGDFDDDAETDYRVHVFDAHGDEPHLHQATPDNK